jgi:hypothetical protein
MPSARPPRFTVSANYRGHHKEAMRSLAASAMCLADDWANKGYADIRITDGIGVTMSRERFRSTMLVVRRLSARCQLC